MTDKRLPKHVRGGTPKRGKPRIVTITASRDGADIWVRRNERNGWEIHLERKAVKEVIAALRNCISEGANP